MERSSAASPGAPSARSLAPPKPRMRELGAEPVLPGDRRRRARTAPCPHAEPGEREIGEGELVVFDMGAISTATAPTAPAPSPPASRATRPREVYELVRAAQQAALDAVRAGRGGKDVDAVARELIDEAGHGEHFGHGLGHGVGIEVHEAPRLSQRSEDVLEAGDVVTVEPGVYLPGSSGSGSRMSSSSPTTATRTSARARRSCGSSAEPGERLMSARRRAGASRAPRRARGSRHAHGGASAGRCRTRWRASP